MEKALVVELVGALRGEEITNLLRDNVKYITFFPSSGIVVYIPNSFVEFE